MNFEIGKLLKVPRGTPGLDPLQIELGEISLLEDRKQEIAFANKSTALELMSAFIKACDILHRQIVQINYEYTQAVKQVKLREAVVMLEIANDVLKQKGLGSSADLRKAVVLSDKEYQSYSQTAEVLEATYEYLRGKIKTFEMAYQSVKKVYYNEDSFEQNQHALREVDESSHSEIVGRSSY